MAGKRMGSRGRRDGWKPAEVRGERKTRKMEPWVRDLRYDFQNPGSGEGQDRDVLLAGPAGILLSSTVCSVSNANRL